MAGDQWSMTVFLRRHYYYFFFSVRWAIIHQGFSWDLDA
jgi:hypothetical protein